jgi:hypothetical protein
VDDDEKQNVTNSDEAPANPNWVTESKELITKFYPNTNLASFFPSVPKVCTIFRARVDNLRIILKNGDRV